jgi:single-strand DNA-binding protein
MSLSLNRCTLLGNIGKDPVIRVTQDGKKVANFSLATVETKDKSDWHNIVVYNQHLVSIVEKFIKKGTKAYIEGKIQTREWKDNSGEKKYITEIILNDYNGNIIVYENRKSDGNNGNAVSDNQMSEDEIPF